VQMGQGREAEPGRERVARLGVHRQMCEARQVGGGPKRAPSRPTRSRAA
jgi:hypothetical protein